MIVSPEHSKFAYLEWDSRWNTNHEGLLADKYSVTNNKNYIGLVTVMGVMHIDLSNEEDVSAFLDQMRAACDLLETAYGEYIK